LSDLLQIRVSEVGPIAVLQNVIEDAAIGLLVQDQDGFYVRIVDPLAERGARAGDFLPDFEGRFDRARLALPEQPVPELRDLVEAVIVFFRLDKTVGVNEVEQSLSPQARYDCASGAFVPP
jgi:hypothetical protein